jgi:hypothetical protein
MSKPARKPRKPANTGGKQAEDAAERKCYIVSGYGTDEVIAARCAEAIPDWADLGDKVQQEIVRLQRAYWNQPVAPRYEVVENATGGRMIGAPAGANVTLHILRSIEAFGSGSEAYMNDRICELSRHFSKGDQSTQLSAGIAFVKGANAADPVQSSLAVQMVVTHDAAMRALNRSTNAEYLEHSQVYGNLAAKLLNAYTRQAEVLAKLQRGGEQIIKHVHIDNRGGQAVVADQLVTGGQNGESGDQPYEQGALGPALLGHDAGGNVVPLSSDGGKEAMPLARGAVAGRA